MSKFSHDAGRHRQGYDNTSTFSLKTAELKMFSSNNTLHEF